MKILLLGDFSGLHLNLRNGLRLLGNDVVLASNGDGSRGFDNDIHFNTNSKIFLIRALQKTFSPIFNLNKLKGFDVVQYISPTFNPLDIIYPYFSEKIIQNNDKVFISICGDTSAYWQAFRNSDLEFSLPHPLVIKKNVRQNYLERNIAIKFHDSFMNKANGIIPSTYDYFVPYKEYSNLRDTILYPIDTDNIKYRENIVKDKVVFFHGINKGREVDKGSDLILKALNNLRAKYPNDVEVRIVTSLPFQEYLKVVNESNVLLDQIWSYSPAMNALNAMAMGKVVLTGAEDEYINHIGLNSVPHFNIKPPVRKIQQVLEYVLENKKFITEWGGQSRQFVEDHHHYVKIANKYKKTWQS